MRFFSAGKVSKVARATAPVSKYSFFFRIFHCSFFAVASRFFGQGAWNNSETGEKMGKMPLPKKLGVIGGSMFAFGLTFGFMAFPPILKSQIHGQVKLKKNSEMREIWSNLPVPMEFKVYLFNVSNPMEITKGEKPILKEVGPFFYDEWKVKLDLEDREEDDTIEYSQRTTWIFNPSKSNGLTGNEILTVPNIVILAIVMAAVRDKPKMLSIVGKGIDSIFKKPETIFIQTKAHDLIFGGLPVDCSVTDFGGAALCSILKESPDLALGDQEGFLKFSLFGHKNGTLDTNRLRVKRGIKNIKQLGEVVEYKGEPHQTVWPEGSRCNEFNGTDSTIFHPHLPKEEDVVSFAPEICRSLSCRWDGTYTSVGGIHANHYTGEFGDPSTDPELNCFCQAEDNCLAKGLYDMFKCLRVPMVGSLPHFYLVDEKYLTQVDGLNPVKENHQLDIDFEPTTGTPMSARKRLQFNMFVFPVDKIKPMKTFVTALLPLFWIEEGITLGDEFLDQIRLAFTAMKAVNGLKWTMMIIGMGLGGAGARLEYKKRQAEKTGTVTKVTPQSESRDPSGTEKTWPLNVTTLQPAQVPTSLDRN